MFDFKFTLQNRSNLYYSAHMHFDLFYLQLSRCCLVEDQGFGTLFCSKINAFEWGQMFGTPLLKMARTAPVV